MALPFVLPQCLFRNQISTVASCSFVRGISSIRASASAWRTGVSHPKEKAQKRKA